MLILLPGHQFNLVLHVQGHGCKLVQGHLKVKVIPRSNCKHLSFYQQAGGGPLAERHSCSDKFHHTDNSALWKRLIQTNFVLLIIWHDG